MVVEWVKTKFGNDALVVDGYLFDKNKENNGIVYWRCHDCRKVTAITEEHNLVSLKHEHNHIPDPYLLLRKKFKTQLKEIIDKQATLSRKTVFEETRRIMVDEERKAGTSMSQSQRLKLTNGTSATTRQGNCLLHLKADSP